MYSHDRNRRSTDGKDNRPTCKYGMNCYQKHPDHHKRFKHPGSNKEKQNRDRQDRRETEIKDNNDRKEKEIKDSKDSKEIKDDKDIKESKDNKDIKESKDNKDSEEIIVDKDSKEVEETKDDNEIKESQDSKEIKENKDINDKNLNEKKESKDDESDKNSDQKETDTNNSNKRKSPEEDESSSAETPKAKKQNISPESNNIKTKEAVNEIEEDMYKNAKELIKKAFLFPLPDDFYHFYNFCKELKANDPITAFKVIDIKLVGPYDVLNGTITEEIVNEKELLTHWRYYYDPPEFQTILKGSDKDGLHFGYWRDRPSSLPVFVASNSSNITHKFKPLGENIFAAVKNYIEEKAKKASPFEKPGLFNLVGRIKIFAKKHDLNLDEQSPKMKAREKLVVARAIHGAGIVVPYNKKTQVGYRELSVTDNQLLKIIKKIDDAKSTNDRTGPLSELQEIVRLATIAGDECDFGTCLELGHDLLSTGSEHVTNAALAVLSIAYNQLDRQPFLKIVEAHMKNRKKGVNPSVLPSTGKHFSLL